MEYVNNSGALRKIPVKVDSVDNSDWIVNNERAFHHFHLEHMVDAEVAINDNDEEDGFYTAHIEIDSTEGKKDRKCAYYKKKNGKVSDDDYISIKKDDTEIEKIYLHDYLDAVDKVNEIYDEELGKERSEEATGPVYGIAELLAFKLDTKGNWEAIIASFAYGELKYYEIDDRGFWRSRYMHGLESSVTNERTPVSSIEDKTLLEKLNSTFGSSISYVVIRTNNISPIESFEPPDKSRRCSAYYLTRIKSNGEKEIFHEDFALQSTKEDLIAQLTLEGGGTIFRTYKVGTVISTTYLDNWSIPVEIEETDGRHEQNVYCIKHKHKDGYHKKKYKDDWKFPIQDEYSIKMNEWEVLELCEGEGEKSIYTGKFPEGFTIADRRYMPDTTDGVEKNKQNDQKKDIYKMTFHEKGGWDEITGTDLKMGYTVELKSKKCLTPAVPAMTKLSKKYLIIGNADSKYPLYKFGTDSEKFEQVYDNVKNFRLKKMKNFSKVKNKKNWSQ